MDRRHFLKTMIYAGAFLTLDSLIFPHKGQESFSKDRNTETIKAGLLTLGSFDHGYKQDEIIDLIGKHISKHNLDIFLGPEWLFLPEKGLYTKKEKDDLVSKLVNTTKDRDTFSVPGTIMWHDNSFFYNSAPIITNGTLLDEYFKRTDGGSINLADERACPVKKYRKGQKRGVYKWRGYTIGVEICADHGHLKEEITNEKLPPLDIYLLSSCGMTLGSYSTPLDKNGYALYSDGYYKASGAAKSTSYQDGEIIDLTEAVEDKNLLIYELSMNKKQEQC
ncbi:hypothetical protein FJZ53_00085 [Candidatus Woesearchaeota archaeon]|nr:hypothetical protein [Candidatus Woesearchaeota archaeon]